MDYTKSVFVFGSNEGGFHGAGAAKVALIHKGAQMGQGYGRQGQSFAIPTKDASIRNTLSLWDIEKYVELFLEYARANPDTEFQVTCIGCGLAGLKHEQVAPMFINAPGNCWFDTNWKPWLGEKRKYWGTFK